MQFTSGIEVKHDIQGVGKNLRNHVSFSIPLEVTGKKSETQMTDDDVWEYMNSRKGPMSCTGLSQVSNYQYYSKFVNNTNITNCLFQQVHNIVICISNLCV